MGSLRGGSAAVREATHAGTWYSSDEAELAEQLEAWLAKAAPTLPLSRVVIAPHAGYRYSGRCAAYAYSHLDTSVKRVFLLGPSHHYYTRKCALSATEAYETPLGNIPIDTEVVGQLQETGKFEIMSKSVDEAEHSLELHLPYVAHLFQGKSMKLVPIMVGSVSAEAEAAYGRLLAPYVDDPANAFVISSDFCHWGSRFSFTYYEKQHGPIWRSIEALDRRGMSVIETGDADGFGRYLAAYENTICGRHPIGVLLHMLRHCKTKIAMRFVQYEQSNQCMTQRDSSVSYASAVGVASSA